MNEKQILNAKGKFLLDKQTVALLVTKFLHFNPLNAKLYPICHLLALLGAHLILHVSRIRVNDNDSSLHVKNSPPFAPALSQMISTNTFL
jgi:hypothetical protein